MPRRSVPVNGAALRAIRERSGLSVQALVRLTAEHEDVSVHPQHVRNLELQRKNASPALIAALANALRVPVVALMRDHSDLVGSK
ncbi:helix-turn-helix domain-containing protein [Micromonospora sp. NPDC049891]|uniref:helix-turn-helix domain-containing protein n=1 Tax=Micromonospora sp. NPDC049891 TaxID=3155655 RepID=UPI00340BF628